MNRIRISGVYGTKTRFEDKHNEKMVSTLLTSKRRSNAEDECKVVFSEVLERELKDYDKIVVEGSLRCRSVNNKAKKKEVYVLADKIEPYYQDEDVNEVEISGELIMDPVKRTTPSGKEITDCPILVPRNSVGRADFIPCISWGRLANVASCLDKGEKIGAKGRLQSRTYHKNDKLYTVHEVSISKFI